MLLRLKSSVLQCKNLLPCKCNGLHWPHLWKIWPIKHPIFLAPLHTSIDVIYAKPKICRYLVVGMDLLPCLSWCWYFMYTLPHFSFTRMSSVGLQRLALFLCGELCQYDLGCYVPTNKRRERPYSHRY